MNFYTANAKIYICLSDLATHGISDITGKYIISLPGSSAQTKQQLPHW